MYVRRAAMRELGCEEKREVGCWANNRVEDSHLPFRRRERAMARFRRMHTLQKFASVHASFHNHFGTERHLTGREQMKANRSAALAEWKRSPPSRQRERGASCLALADSTALRLRRVAGRSRPALRPTSNVSNL